MYSINSDYSRLRSFCLRELSWDDQGLKRRSLLIVHNLDRRYNRDFHFTWSDQWSRRLTSWREPSKVIVFPVTTGLRIKKCNITTMTATDLADQLVMITWIIFVPQLQLGTAVQSLFAIVVLKHRPSEHSHLEATPSGPQYQTTHTHMLGYISTCLMVDLVIFCTSDGRLKNQAQLQACTNSLGVFILF